MRASTILFTFLATLAAAAPGQQATADVSPILQKRCEAAGVCSQGGDDGTFCSNLKCCSDSKSGRGGAVCCCN
ncbi:hypothetical protein ColKHC_12768 [Colletotrichum higginsianum]|nr:hypothetical protein ColKHC_12768 [Colletotrichum higginsianum]